MAALLFSVNQLNIESVFTTKLIMEKSACFLAWTWVSCVPEKCLSFPSAITVSIMPLVTPRCSLPLLHILNFFMFVFFRTKIQRLFITTNISHFIVNLKCRPERKGLLNSDCITVVRLGTILEGLWQNVAKTEKNIKFSYNITHRNNLCHLTLLLDFKCEHWRRGWLRS